MAANALYDARLGAAFRRTAADHRRGAAGGSPYRGRHYGKLVGFWALAYVALDLLHESASATGQRLLDMALNTYLPFLLLLGALFVITGGLRIRGAPRGTPGVNTALLAISTAVSSCIGTPGTSMLMLRPLLAPTATAGARRMSTCSTSSWSATSAAR